MMMHPELLYSLERQRHAELIRQGELRRLARDAHARKPGLLSFRRYPGAVALARRWWGMVTGLLIGSRQAPTRIPGEESGRPSTTVSPAVVGGQLTGSASARSR